MKKVHSEIVRGMLDVNLFHLLVLAVSAATEFALFIKLETIWFDQSLRGIFLRRKWDEKKNP